MKHFKNSYKNSNFFKPKHLVWKNGGGKEVRKERSEAEKESFRGVMCKEKESEREKEGGEIIYGRLCNLEEIEKRTKVQDFADNLLKILDPEASKEPFTTEERWALIKGIIPKEEDLDNMVQLAEKAEKADIKYKNGILEVYFTLPDQEKKRYRLIIDEKAAADYYTRQYDKWRALEEKRARKEISARKAREEYAEAQAVARHAEAILKVLESSAKTEFISKLVGSQEDLDKLKETIRRITETKKEEIEEKKEKESIQEPEAEL